MGGDRDSGGTGASAKARKMVFLIDFDGTLAVGDTVDRLLAEHADPAWEALEADWMANRISALQCMKSQIELVHADALTLGRFFRSIVLDRHFRAFWEFVRTRAVVAVVSEFGRTFRENGGRGTDHGHGSVCWLLGGALKCPPIVGELVALTATTLNQNRDLPVLNPLPEVLGGLFARQFGLRSSAVEHIFPGIVPRDLQLI